MTDNTLYTPSNILSGVDISVTGEIQPLSEKTADGILQREFYFPASHGIEKPTNAYGMLCMPDGGKKYPLIMIIGNSRQSVDSEILNFFAKNGFAAFMYDYLGERKSAAKYTFYSPEKEYANIEKAGRKLQYVDTNARETAPFEWLLLANRAFLRALSFDGVDSANAGIMGIGLGANTAWMLSALCKEVKALCTVFSAGWYEYVDSFKYAAAKGAMPHIDEERERWIAGLSVQAYAKYIQIPLLYMSASNSRFTDMDRTYDTLTRVASKNIYAYIAPGRNRTVGREGANNAVLFFRKYLNGEDIQIEPYFSAEIKILQGSVPQNCEPGEEASKGGGNDIDNKISIKLSGLDESVKDFWIYYSLDQVNPGTRYFYKPQIPLIKGDCVTISPQVSGSEKLIVAYAVIEYKTGFVLSLAPNVLQRQPEGAPDNIRRNPVIYNSAMGTADFYEFYPYPPSYREILLKDAKKDIVILPGAGEIKGIVCKNGGIGTYKISVASFAAQEEESFKFDVYSQSAQKLYVYCLDKAGYTDEHWHFATVELLGGEMWQPLEIKKQNLKTAEGHPLKGWEDISMIGFYCEGELLINNLLWF